MFPIAPNHQEQRELPERCTPLHHTLLFRQMLPYSWAQSAQHHTHARELHSFSPFSLSHASGLLHFEATARGTIGGSSSIQNH